MKLRYHHLYSHLFQESASIIHNCANNGILYYIVHVVRECSPEHVTQFIESEEKSEKTEDSKKGESDRSGSSSSSSSSSESGSDSSDSGEDSAGDDDNEDNKSEAEIKGLKEEGDKSERGGGHSSAEVDTTTSPREGAVSPTPGSEAPKIIVTSQEDSPRSHTSDVDNGNEIPRPVTRIGKRGD